MRVGIMSFAHVHADGFASILKDYETVEFVGFSDIDKNRGNKVAKQYGIKHFASHQSLLQENLDAVVICSENAKHLEDIKLAAEAGVHILCEKPIEISLEAAEEIGKLIKEKNLNFMTAFPMRFDPTMKKIKHMLEQNQLGTLYAVNGINHAEIPRRHRAWFADKKLAGGGAVMDHTVHLVDLLRWFSGSEVKTVYAEIGNPFVKDVDIDTAGLVTIEFENGLIATIDASWSRPEAVYPTWGHVKMQLVAEKGVVETDAFAQKLNQYSKLTQPNATWVGWGSNSTEAMLDEFFASIKEKRQPSINWQDGYEALKVTLAAYESAKTASVINLSR